MINSHRAPFEDSGQHSLPWQLCARPIHQRNSAIAETSDRIATTRLLILRVYRGLRLASFFVADLWPERPAEREPEVSCPRPALAPDFFVNFL